MGVKNSKLSHHEIDIIKYIALKYLVWVLAWMSETGTSVIR